MPGPAAERTLFTGQRRAVFRLALRTGFLTLVTLGFYRFWMKTRLRRYYWSSLRPMGLALEYTGNGAEKLMGFLVAVTFLAFYIGLVNLLFAYLSFTLFKTEVAVYVLSFLGLMPFIFAARYRARRYVLARSRWRGIRFGLEPGAWGYAWRASLYWVLTIASLGILYPLQLFRLEEYRTDRTWFGDTRLSQGGSWRMLLRPATGYYIGLAVTGMVILAVVAGGDEGLLSLLLVSLPVAFFGLAHLHVRAFARMAEAKSLGGAGFTSAPSSGRVIGIYMGGYSLAFAILLAVTLAATLLLMPTLRGIDPADITGSPMIVTGVALMYFALFLIWGALTQAFVTFPRLRHYAQTLGITGGAALDATAQIPADAGAGAEGLAEALDVGAAL